MQFGIFSVDSSANKPNPLENLQGKSTVYYSQTTQVHCNRKQSGLEKYFKDKTLDLGTQSVKHIAHTQGMPIVCLSGSGRNRKLEGKWPHFVKRQYPKKKQLSARGSILLIESDEETRRVPLIGAADGQWSHFREVKIKHSLVVFPEKLGAFRRFPPVIKK